MSLFTSRMDTLRAALSAAGLEVALVSDDDSVYYLTGFYDYLHMSFGRPTLLVVPADGQSLLITPTMELEMAEALAVVDRIAPWNDGLGEEWREALPGALEGAGPVAIEPELMPPVVREFVDTLIEAGRLADVTPIIAEMRMIKSAEAVSYTHLRAHETLRYLV